jgi:hypothetical protein
MGFTCTPKQEIFDRRYNIRIGETIMHIIANMFKENNWYIIMYVCSADNQQDRQRSILFRNWYSNSQLASKIVHTPKKIGDSYYGSLYSKKHPDIEEIEYYLDNLDDL